MRVFRFLISPGIQFDITSKTFSDALDEVTATFGSYFYEKYIDNNDFLQISVLSVNDVI